MGDLHEFLSGIRLEGGDDTDDLGQIRFSLLLSAFAYSQLESHLEMQSATSDEKRAGISFGAVFLTVLGATPSAIIHIQQYPSSTLACFSEDHARKIVAKCFTLLRRNAAFMVVDLLLQFSRCGLLTEEDFMSVRSASLAFV